mmetsp:Transcript_54484/g.151861  ORF Transcript_54484/g.151861 Transcript_54484/m.151861 type:complete len:431 (-) Transcript_54484:2-1294(-)
MRNAAGPPVAPAEANISFHPRHVWAFERARTLDVQGDGKRELGARIQRPDTQAGRTMEDAQARLCLVRAGRGFVRHGQIVDDDHIALLPLVAVADVWTVQEVSDAAHKLVHLRLAPCPDATELAGAAGRSDPLEDCTCHARVKVERFAPADSVGMDEGVDNTSVGVHARAPGVLFLQLRGKKVVCLPEMRKGRVARPSGSLDDVINDVAEHLPAEGAVVVPLWSHLVEAMPRIIGEAKDVTVRALLVIPMRRVQGALPKRQRELALLISRQVLAFDSHLFLRGALAAEQRKAVVRHEQLQSTGQLGVHAPHEVDPLDLDAAGLYRDEVGPESLQDAPQVLPAARDGCAAPGRRAGAQGGLPPLLLLQEAQQQREGLLKRHPLRRLEADLIEKLQDFLVWDRALRALDEHRAHRVRLDQSWVVLSSHGAVA